MEKLSVRNFGPIEQADIDIKKINVLIGPQGSGKSTIAKVISAFMNHNQIRDEWDGHNFKEKLIEDYGLAGFFEDTTRISIKSADNRELYIDNTGSANMVMEESVRYYTLPKSVYIPAERVLIPLIAENSFLFIRENISIQKYITDFGILFQTARKSIKEQTVEFLGGVTYKYDNNMDKVTLRNGKTITLSESSNGVQSALPLLLAIRYLSDKAKTRELNNISIVIEEPELSLFPSTQNELIKLILEMILPLNYHLTITTHSPYTLTALNNLIYAYQVGTDKKEVEAVIPGSLWLDPENIGAWYVSDGTVRSIIDEDLMQIKAEEIDKISDVLNEEYEKIMDLKYEQ